MNATENGEVSVLSNTVVTELKGGPYDGRKITTEAEYADQPQQRKFPLLNDQGPPWVVYDGSSAYDLTYIGIEEK